MPKRSRQAGCSEPLFPACPARGARARPRAARRSSTGDRIVSRGELLELIGRLAGALRAAGLGPGRGLAVATAVSPGGLRRAHGRARAGLPRRGGPARLHRRAARPRARHGRRRPPRRPVDRDVAPADRRRTAAIAVPRAHARAPSTCMAAPSEAGGAGSRRSRPARDDVAFARLHQRQHRASQGMRDHLPGAHAHWAWQPRVWSPVAAEFATAFQRYLLFGTLASMVVLEFLGALPARRRRRGHPRRRPAAAVPVRDRAPPDHRLHHHRAPAVPDARPAPRASRPT